MRISHWAASFVLTTAFFMGGGLPGLNPLSANSATASQAQTPLMLFAVTELHAGQNGHYVTRADINGTAINVMVDTGASMVALSYQDAQDAGLRPRSLDYTIPLATANGLIKGAPVRLKRVVINNVRVDDVEAMVLPEGAMQGTLLGMSFLSRLSSFKVEDGVLYLRK